MKYVLLLITPLLGITLLAGVALGQHQNRTMAVSEGRAILVASSDGWRWGRRIARLKDQLGLSDEQATQIRKVLGEARKPSIKIRADLKVARIELGELATQEKIDRGKIDAKLKQIGQLKLRLLGLRVDVVLATRNILTSEQVKNADRWFRRYLSRERGRGRRLKKKK